MASGQVAAVKAAMMVGPFAHVPIISNGNIRCWADCAANLALTGADGVMSAEGILDDPSLFLGHHAERKRREAALRASLQASSQGSSQGSLQGDDAALLARLPPPPPPGSAREALWDKLCAEPLPAHSPAALSTASTSGAGPASLGASVDRLALALEYLALATVHPVKHSSVIFHTRRMCRDALHAYQMTEELAIAQVALRRDGARRGGANAEAQTRKRARL